MTWFHIPSASVTIVTRLAVFCGEMVAKDPFTTQHRAGGNDCALQWCVASQDVWLSRLPDVPVVQFRFHKFFKAPDSRSG